MENVRNFVQNKGGLESVKKEVLENVLGEFGDMYKRFLKDSIPLDSIKESENIFGILSSNEKMSK